MLGHVESCTIRVPSPYVKGHDWIKVCVENEMKRDASIERDETRRDKTRRACPVETLSFT